MRRTFATLLAAATVALTGGFAHAAAMPIEVHIGMGLSKPPYIMESGKAGIEYEIADQALAAAGYKMIPEQFPPARGLALFRAGVIDGLLTVDKGIGGNDYFSDAYLTYQNVATTLESRHIRLRNIEDLLDYSVAGFQNANVILGERFKEVAMRHPQYQEYAQQILQNNLLYTRRVDVVVGDRLIFLYFRTRLAPTIDASQKVTFHPIFPPNPRLAVFHDRTLRDKFNAGLQTIRHNGTYDAILAKYKAYIQPQDN